MAILFVREVNECPEGKDDCILGSNTIIPEEDIKFIPYRAGAALTGFYMTYGANRDHEIIGLLASIRGPKVDDKNNQFVYQHEAKMFDSSGHKATTRIRSLVIAQVDKESKE